MNNWSKNHWLYVPETSIICLKSKACLKCFGKTQDVYFSSNIYVAEFKGELL